MASAPAPANELAMRVPATASSQAVPPPAASTAEAVDLFAGGANLGLLLLLLLLRCGQASSPEKRTERRDYVHQVFISSYLFMVFLLLPFCFLAICRRYFVCVYSYMGSDSAYEVLFLFCCILHMI